MNVIESCGAFSITIIMDAIKSGLLFSNLLHFQFKWTTISYLLTRWCISWMWRKGGLLVTLKGAQQCYYYINIIMERDRLILCHIEYRQQRIAMESQVPLGWSDRGEQVISISIATAFYDCGDTFHSNWCAIHRGISVLWDCLGNLMAAYKVMTKIQIDIEDLHQVAM